MKAVPLLILLGLCTACASGFTALSPAPQTVGDLRVNGISGWSAVPREYVPRGVDAVWTRNGTNLDSILIFADIRHGDSLFPAPASYRPAPRFQRDMGAPDIARLVESAFSTRLGEAHALVSVSNLQPLPGKRFRFDINHVASNGFEVRGLVYGGVNDGRLWLLVYQAAALHYFDASLPQVDAMFASIRRRR